MDYTYEQYCSDLDKIAYLDENFVTEDISKITATLSKAFGNVSNIVSLAKNNPSNISVKDITSALKDVNIYSFLKLSKFSIKKMAGYINGALSVIDNTLLKAISALHTKGVFNHLVDGTVTMDQVLKDHPILKKVTGPVVAGIILMIWLNMTFSGKFSSDMDLVKMFKSATGKFSLEEVFATPNGIKMLVLLTTGIVSAGALSFPWLAATGANLALAILYTGFKHRKNISKEELSKMKQKILKRRLSEGFGQHLIESDLNKNKAFVRKIYNMAQPNPIGRGAYFALKSDDGKDTGFVKFELFGMQDFVHISDILVAEDKGGKGFGDYVMKIITKEADKDNIDLHLAAVPTAHQGKKIPKSKLVKFYKKHGFVSIGGDEMERVQKRKPIKLSGRKREIKI